MQPSSLTATHLIATNRLRIFAVILFSIALLSGQTATAQYYTNKRHENKNNPNYDQRKKLTYGFLIGLHTTAYQIKYSDAFVTPAFDSVYSVDANWRQGFALGFIVNYKVAEFLDLRITPQVAFYEHSLSYRYLRTTGQPTNEQIIETTMVELPILGKYQSIRRGNFRMYMIGGVKPGIEASGKKDLDAISSRLSVREFNLAIEGGVGFDFYYPLFKFSPEIRFSKGLSNLLKDPNNPFGQPLSRINTNTITVYLVFQ